MAGDGMSETTLHRRYVEALSTYIAATPAAKAAPEAIVALFAHNLAIHGANCKGCS